jgi:hypothetical protein
VKDQALYHLLMVSARSTRALLEPSAAPRVDLVASTLVLSKEGRGPIRLTWQDESGPRALEVDLARFSFYTRGDVPSLLAKRPAGLDLRADNWLEAHRLWGEILGDPRLGDSLRPDARAMPTGDGAGKWWSHVATFWCVVFALAASSVALATNAPPLLLATLVGALALGLLASPRSPLPVVVPVAFALAAAVMLHPGSSQLRGAVSGVALLAATSQLAPRRDGSSRLALLRGLAATVAVGLALGVAPAAWWVAAAVVFGSDLIACGLRREHDRALVACGFCAGAIVIGVATSTVVVRAPLFGSTDPGTAWQLAALAAGFLAFAVAVLMFPYGVRDRLSAIVATSACAVIGLVSLGERATVVWLAPVACGALLSWLGEQLGARQTTHAPPARDGFVSRAGEPAPSVGDGPVPVELRRSRR